MLATRLRLSVFSFHPPAVARAALSLFLAAACHGAADAWLATCPSPMAAWVKWCAIAALAILALLSISALFRSGGAPQGRQNRPALFTVLWLAPAAPIAVAAKTSASGFETIAVLFLSVFLFFVAAVFSELVLVAARRLGPIFAGWSSCARFKSATARVFVAGSCAFLLWVGFGEDKPFEGCVATFALKQAPAILNPLAMIRNAN